VLVLGAFLMQFMCKGLGRYPAHITELSPIPCADSCRVRLSVRSADRGTVAWLEAVFAAHLSYAWRWR